ncbi:MAG: 50S ribosomal protein L18 [Candidatus Margulisiibacteriota bacterium]
MARKKKIVGTKERPRISVFRSLKNITAQIVDDVNSNTLCSATTIKKTNKGNNSNIAAAIKVGKQLAEKALKLGIKKVVFDRGKFLYHGRIKALADAARQGGLEF